MCVCVCLTTNEYWDEMGRRRGGVGSKERWRNKNREEFREIERRDKGNMYNKKWKNHMRFCFSTKATILLLEHVKAFASASSLRLFYTDTVILLSLTCAICPSICASSSSDYLCWTKCCALNHPLRPPWKSYYRNRVTPSESNNKICHS